VATEVTVFVAKIRRHEHSFFIGKQLQDKKRIRSKGSGKKMGR
jgi:hypothetical protein